MKKSGCILALLLLSTILSPAFPAQTRSEGADNLRFRTVYDDNITLSDVSTLYQDSRGYIWIVSYSSLVRYDGYRMRPYPLDHEGGKADGYLRRIIEEKSGKMILGTERGLMRLDPATGDVAAIDDSLTGHINVADMERDSLGRIWIGGDKGVYRKDADSDTFTRMDFRTGEGGGKYVTDVIDLLIDRYGFLWITTWSSGLFRYDMNSGRLYSYSEENLRSAYVLASDSEDNLWIGTWGRGLLKAKITPGYTPELEYRRFRHSPARSDSLLDDVIYALSLDPERNLWVGSRSGLSILPYSDAGAGKNAPAEVLNGGYDKDRFLNYSPSTAPGSLPFNEVNCVLCTLDSSMWVSMFGGVVCKAESFPLEDGDDSLVDLSQIRRQYSTSSVRSLLRETPQSLWLGISGHGMVRLNSQDGSFRGYRDIRGFEGLQYTNNFDAMLPLRSGEEIAFGSYDKGLWIYNPSTGETRVVSSTTCPALGNDCITALAEDGDGNVWIGTREGVYVMDGESFGVRSLSSISGGLPGLDRKISALSVNPVSGEVWIATAYDGIIRCTGEGSVRLYPAAQCGGTGSFNCIMADSRGRVWAGSTWNGLYRLCDDGNSFLKEETFVILDGQGITNIAEDPHGRLWVTTSAALLSFVCNPSGDFSSISYSSIAPEGGLDFFNHNACLYVPERDCMAFGSFKGIRLFSCVPSGTVAEGGTPLEITGISADGHNVPLSDEVRLTRGITSLEISFSLFDYLNPSGDIYRYRLYPQGQEEDGEWRIVNGGGSKAVFKGLKPGKYVFEVYGTRSGEALEGESRSIVVAIPGNPWLSWWAFLIYAVLLSAGIIAAFLIVRSSYRFRRRMEMEKLQQQKAEEVNQAKLQFFTNVSHEFLTPLSIILASVESIEPRDAKEKKLYNIMSVNAVRLVRLVQQVLEFRKAESGNLRLKVSYGNIARFTRHCVEAFAPLVGKHNLKISFRSNPKDIFGWYDTDKIDKIAYNLISNAVKYTPENGKITVELSSSEDGEWVELVCSNDGKLMSRSTIAGLFRRFYEGEYRQFKTIGTGIGLSLVKSLVTLHKGTIRVESNETVHNRFIVRLPVGKGAYTPEEIDESTEGERDMPLALTLNETVVKSEAVVLFVDDSEDLTELFDGIMSRRFNVRTANSAAEALEILGREHIDAVVSDVAMPGMDGLELCSKIKSDKALGHIPVILLTAKTGDAYSIEGYQSGADGYLTKPCNYSVLSALIHNLLEKQARADALSEDKMVFELKDVEYTSSDKVFIQKAVDLVNAHIADSEFDLPQFAEAMATSRTVLTEKFKELLGTSPMLFLLNARLQAAYKMISERQDNFRVSDIAYSVGFSDAKYFSKRFKAKFGLSPKDLKEAK